MSVDKTTATVVAHDDRRWRHQYQRTDDEPDQQNAVTSHTGARIRTTIYANECYLLLPSVFIVTAMLLKQLLDMQFYMVTW